MIIYQGEKQSRRCIQMHEMYSSEKNVLFDILVTNYELVSLDKSILKKFKWSAIVSPGDRYLVFVGGAIEIL